MAVTIVAAIALSGCSDNKHETATPTNLRAVIMSTASDGVPAPVRAALPGTVNATKQLAKARLPLHDCVEARLTTEAETVSLGWVLPNRGLAAFVPGGVCDVTLANGAAVLCGGGPERFAGDPATLERSGGQLLVCPQSGSNAAFLTVTVPAGAAWLAVQRGDAGWDVYKVGNRPVVRVITDPELEDNRLTIITKALDATGHVIAEKPVTGVVAG